MWSREMLTNCCAVGQVRHEEANSWVCPGCGQYNGWTEDGDYNRDLGLDTRKTPHTTAAATTTTTTGCVAAVTSTRS